MFPPQEYTGIPVNFILKQAKPKPGADTLFVVATDGYKVEFELETVIKDDNMLLILEKDDTLEAHSSGNMQEVTGSGK